MKILVVGSNGRVGKLIVKEAVEREFDVVGVARGENKSIAPNFIQKDIMDLTKDDVKGFDVVVDAFGTWKEEDYYLHSTTLNHISDLVSDTNTRLIVVGGAGSLYLDKSHTKQVQDLPDFPEAFKPLASSMAKSLEELRLRSDVKWTYISPAADFQVEGKKTGSYILGGEEYFTNNNGESMISYADYALALVDEIENKKYENKRISVIGI